MGLLLLLAFACFFTVAEGFVFGELFNLLEHASMALFAVLSFFFVKQFVENLAKKYSALKVKK
ncbi:hypothetical protein AUJ65_04180 [Candidatus Micrarchaeota archaeon CG1_02_51_15]|nr:MAG: hypothetical protein AUJ65_04180 [Candidatus Micrarchaeota archaeon CG1_02_51_15]